jgi:hypothetical protein
MQFFSSSLKQTIHFRDGECWVYLDTSVGDAELISRGVVRHLARCFSKNESVVEVLFLWRTRGLNISISDDSVPFARPN